jgi:1,4-alpha-glucan branching enzyme
MTPWGNGIAYEREPVRQYITDAPLYWLTEYRLDGLRFDAIDQIKDSSGRTFWRRLPQKSARRSRTGTFT